ncbi:MAG TPA: DUF2059 domain-containing protein [Mesorhizobium sp.]|jgi:hypothetical protein|nr:DUF2059 domain-containing protein [Mesorhizobium sp.]
MTFACRTRLVPALMMACAVAWTAVPARSQEVSESHLQAARAAVSAIRATEAFDAILPNAGAALKNQLIQKNPDLEALIVATVDEKTLALVPRRGDLEREAALAYARVFNEDELNAIAEFYKSPAGLKLLSDGALVTREVGRAAEIWQRGIARDLAQAVGEVLVAATPDAPAPAATDPAVAPAEGAN